MIRINILKILYFIPFLLCFGGCQSKSAGPLFVVTGNPLAAIVKELAGANSEVYTLVPPGVSPHTFAPKPSDLYKVQAAEALFFVSPEMDGWAATLSAKNKIEILDMIPKELLLEFAPHSHDTTDTTHTDHSHAGHDHEGHNHAEKPAEKDNKDSEQDTVYDPHFWTDPLTVKALLPALADTLAKIDPENAEKYRSNAEIFAGRLDVLHRQLRAELKPVMGRPVFLFHPSFRYMLKRYKMFYAGAIEEFPGSEPSPKYIAELVKRIEGTGARAVFTEPQLPEAPAKTISEAAGVPLYTLDPVGGVKGRKSYSDLMIYNAKVLKKALR